MIFAKKYAIFICLVLISQLINGYVSTFAFVILTLYSLKHATASIQALSFLPFLYLGNPTLFHPCPYWQVARWALLLTASYVLIREYLKKKPVIPVWFLYLMIFDAFAILSSVLYSYDLVTSIVKLSIFSVIIIAVLLGFKAADTDFKPWFFTVFSIVVLLGVPLMFLSNGYIRNGYGFQGILNQPNGYGIYLAPFVTWMTVNIFTSKKMNNIFFHLIFMLAFIQLYMSMSRTSLFTVVISFSLMVVISILSESAFRNYKYALSNVLYKRVYTIIFVIIVVIALPSSFSSDNIVIKKIVAFTFKMKKDEHVDKEKSILNSRKETIDISMRGFEKSPIIGIGFGISADPNHFIAEKTSLGVPTSGSAEKGNIVTALLEETGLIGFTSFLLFILALSIPLIKKKRYGAFAVLISAVVLNMGEMVFFSPGGLGCQVFLMMGFARSRHFKIE